MKKFGVLILLLALCLIAMPMAQAERAPVVRSDSLAAYTDGDGHLFLSGRDKAVNAHDAQSVAGIDAYRVLFFSADGQGSDDLYMIDLETLQETLVAKGVHDVCLADEDSVWIVADANRRELIRMNLADMTTRVAYTAEEPISRLYRSIEGLAFQLSDQAGAMLYVADTDSFEFYGVQLPDSGLLTESNEVYLTDEGELYLKSGFNYTSTLIDSDVTAYTLMGNTIYYLSRNGSALRLKACDQSTRVSKYVLTPGVKMENQLAASEDTLFMLTADGSVCKVNTEKGTLSVFKHYADLAPYKLPDGYTVNGLRIEAMSGQLNIYAELQEKTAKPEFSFIAFDSEPVTSSTLLKLIDVNVLKSEESSWEMLKPTAQYQPLARGSRGDAVRAIQQPLYDLGYYDYYVDGIFGPRTQAAVQLLQFDLDRPVTGIADSELQRIILSGSLKAYDPYRQLARGSKGLRVRLMQERLRELGYLADAADGIFGPRTLKAVQLFQSENGLEPEKGATRDTLKRLYSPSAQRCSSYIDLYPGDTGCRVRELNNRLRELYYLEDSPGSVYTSATASAVRVFQRTVGMRETGEATQAVLRVLFAHDAPEAPGYIVLRRGDHNERVRRLQRRLKDLGYYTGSVDGYYGSQTKDAVALFQKAVGLKPTGVATVRTQQLLFSSDAPHYVKPTVIGVPDIYVEDYDYRKNGIYFISDDNTSNGFILFGWYTDGSVESYDVRITDDRGHTLANTNTIRTSTGISIATLDYDRVYTLSVTAIPEDGDPRHVTSAEIGFARIDTEEDDILEAEGIGHVGNPVITVETVARVEGGVRYLLPGNVTFRWHAEGDVDSYYVEIRDENDDVVISATMTDEQATIRSEAMNEGEVYTIFVSAIPKFGDIDDARVKFLRFSLPVIALPSPDPTPIPTASPTPEPAIAADITPVPEENEDLGGALEPVPTAETTPEPTEEPTPIPVAEVTPESEFDDEALTNEAEEDIQDNDFEENIQVPESEEDIPEGETEDDVFGAEEEDIPEDETEEDFQQSGEEDIPEEEFEEETLDSLTDQPEKTGDTDESSVTAPDISFSEVADVQNGISYVTGEILTMTWYSEGDVAGYHVELLDSDNNLLDSKTVTDNSLSAYTASLDPTEVYTLVVTAIPASGGVGDGKTSAAMFAQFIGTAGDTVEDRSETDDPQAPANNDDSTEGAGEDTDSTRDENDDSPDDSWAQTEDIYEEPKDDQGPSDGSDEGSQDAYEEPQESYEEPQEAWEEPEESGEEPEESYVEPEGSWEEPEESYVEPEETLEEPEEAYVEPEETWDEPEEAYVEPEETWEEPEEAYVEPEESREEPEETWEEPEEAYVEPEESWEEAYVEPEETWEEPEEAYVEPEESWEEPEEAYVEPEETWEEPEEAYVEPEESWEEPEETWEEPEESWEEPEESWEEPEEAWEEPEESREEPEEEELAMNLSPDEIKGIQKRLVKLGWLTKDSYTKGTLDEVTIDAIMSFQDYCNSEYGMSLSLIDSYDPYVDEETIELLNSEDYSNPYA